MITFEYIQKILDEISDYEKAKKLMKFFQVKPGGYGEGDQFIGVSVPQIRSIAKNFYNMENKEIEKLLLSKIHEHRLFAILIMLKKYNKSKNEIHEIYTKHIHQINNWDLVDTSAEKIIGNYFYKKQKDFILNLSISSNIWYRRIAMISTMHQIKKHEFKFPLQICDALLHDKHPIINKAVGWMLKEIGKRDINCLKNFLFIHYQKMPRITLRCAIEKLNIEEKKFYIKKSYLQNDIENRFNN